MSTLKDKIRNEFERSKDALPAFTDLRNKAIEAFSRVGIPSRRDEEYKYTNTEAYLKGDFSLSASPGKLSADTVQKYTLSADIIQVVLLNGVFAPHYSSLNALPKGLTISSIKEAAEIKSAALEKHWGRYADIQSDPFISLNTALGLDGVFIHVAAGAAIEKTVHILQVSSVGEQLVMNSRNLVVVEKNAQFTFVEHFVGNVANVKSFHNALSEVLVEEGAIVSHYKIQEEEGSAMQVNTCQVQQYQKSVYNNYTFTFGGEMVRNNLNVVLENSYTETHLYGLYITEKNQLVDNHTLVDHRKPNCESNELYKGIAKDNSTATFNGKIYVRKDAQKTNAFQSNKNILLGEEATINTKPQLEIYADDVKCSHGTSTGKIDQEALFYLRSRGIGVPAAQQLLMHAFAEEVVDAIKDENIKSYVENLLQKKF